MLLRPHRARTASRLPTVLAVVALLLPLGAQAEAGPSAVPSARWDVPGVATVRILGHGYGHGHGMSQYGAEGAARAGLTYAQIAEFYYAGTQWGTAEGPVAVNLTGDTTDDVVVKARPTLMVRSLGSGRRWTLPAKSATQWRLVARGAARTAVQWRARGAWKQWRVVRGDAEFSARGPVTLVTPAKSVTYRGKLRSASPSAGSTARDTVNVLSLENYLKGVVPLEIPASWSPEAVRAQAVAARTYAAYERAHPLAGHFQICDTTSCQVYGGYSAEHPLSNAAVAATAGQVLTVDGAPAFTQFASSNGGWSSAGSVPYLAARPDPYDGWAGNPVHQWQTDVPADRIESAWPRIGDLTTMVVEARDGNGDWGGRVSKMTFVGSQGQVTVSGDQVRSALGLRSTWFTFEVAPPVGARAR
ncbi:SpoIID/LytB domain-containing protein [Nocardioides houyundeii]|uniref:SpoIID/LytB domain-containing protein n=1 Tax=Nocardioides houyundeii TaxID=2045452 RepID=UPI000DF45A0D|nr:SpoIID/LytB domain-containing protein [Nocardioides houyundeii]